MKRLILTLLVLALSVGFAAPADSVEVVYEAEYVHLLYGHLGAAHNLLVALARADELTLEQVKAVRELLYSYEATLDKVEDYLVVIEAEGSLSADDADSTDSGVEP